MAFTLGTIITSARDRSSAFHPTRVPNGVLARYCTDLQNDLIVRAASSEPTYLAQSAVVVVSLAASSAIGTAGAGTTGGVPGVVSDAGVVSTSESSAGALVTLGLTSADGASILVAERVVTSATATVLTSTGAGRTVNADIGRLLVITAGAGAGQVREITANTATTWTHASWLTTTGYVLPDSTSLMQVVAPLYQGDETAGVVTAIPAESTRTGYLVKLTSAGVPYIDFTAPLVATVDAGVPLPAMQTLIGGTVRYSDDTTDPLTITSYARRFDATPTNAVYPVGETIHLCGDATDWTDVTSLELRYTPVAPTFTALTDLFLLPDAARACVVAQTAAFMALRVMGSEGIAIDASAYQAAATAATDTYLSSVRLQARGRRFVMRGQD